MRMTMTIAWGVAAALVATAVLSGCRQAQVQDAPAVVASRPAAGAQGASQPPANTDAAGSASAVAIGKPIPDFELTDINGNVIRKADYEGKVLVVDFWATWCKPCTKKLLAYQPIYDQRRAEGLEFIVVSSDDKPETVKGWLKTEHPELTMPFTMKSDLTTAVFWGGQSKYAIPVAKIIDRKGVLRYDLGPESTMEEFEAAIETLLAE